MCMFLEVFLFVFFLQTETVKDLAKSLGIQVVVFNCSDGLTYQMMGRFFSGSETLMPKNTTPDYFFSSGWFRLGVGPALMSSIGISFWFLSGQCCSYVLTSIDIEVLSVIAGQILTIQNVSAKSRDLSCVTFLVVIGNYKCQTQCGLYGSHHSAGARSVRRFHYNEPRSDRKGFPCSDVFLISQMGRIRWAH